MAETRRKFDQDKFRHRGVQSGVTDPPEASVGCWLRFSSKQHPAAGRLHHAEAYARYAA
jgi:hypothetical protein